MNPKKKKRGEEKKIVKEYEIHFSNEAYKIWNMLDKKVKAEILAEIYDIAHRRKWGIKLENFYFPTPNGRTIPCFRVRKEWFRVIFCIDYKKRKIYITRIRKRSKAYRKE